MRVDSDRNTNGTHVKGSLGTAHHHVLLLLAHGRRKLPDLDSTKDETIKLIENVTAHAVTGCMHHYF